MKIEISKYTHIKSPFVISIGGKLDRNYYQVDAFDLSTEETSNSDEEKDKDICEDSSSSI